MIDAEIAAKRAERIAKSGPNWLAGRLQKRAVGRRHKPGLDYVAMKVAQRERDEALAKQDIQTAVDGIATELQKAEDLDKMTNEGAA